MLNELQRTDRRENKHRVLKEDKEEQGLLKSECSTLSVRAIIRGGDRGIQIPKFAVPTPTCRVGHTEEVGSTDYHIPKCSMMCTTLRCNHRNLADEQKIFSGKWDGDREHRREDVTCDGGIGVVASATSGSSVSVTLYWALEWS